MCVITRWIKQGVTAVESPAAQTLNAASFVKNWSEISKEINWQEGKFKFDIPTRVWQEPLSVELDGPQWDRGSCRDPAGSGEQGPHLIVFLVLRERGSCPWFCIRLTQRRNDNTHTHTGSQFISAEIFIANILFRCNIFSLINRQFHLLLPQRTCGGSISPPDLSGLHSGEVEEEKAFY